MGSCLVNGIIHRKKRKDQPSKTNNQSQLKQRQVHPIFDPQFTNSDKKTTSLSPSFISKQLTPIEIKNNYDVPFNWIAGEVIGEGAYGQVLQCFNKSNGQTMVVKMVNFNEKDFVKERISALDNEMRILEKLKHPNIVTYYGMEKRQLQINIFLEYIEGGSLAETLQRFGSLKESLISKYLQQILKGLQYLHKNKIIHRDLKGSNILVSNQGICKISDFGSSIIIDQLKNKNFSGTPHWMAPEVARQEIQNKKSDIWSIGCLIIEMATGQPPFSELNQSQMIEKLKNLKTAPHVTTLSLEGQDLLKKCLKLNYKQRWSCKKLLEHPFLNICESPLKKNNRNSIQEKQVGLTQKFDDSLKDSKIIEQNKNTENKKLLYNEVHQDNYEDFPSNFFVNSNNAQFKFNPIFNLNQQIKKDSQRSFKNSQILGVELLDQIDQQQLYPIKQNIQRHQNMVTLQPISSNLDAQSDKNNNQNELNNKSIQIDNNFQENGEQSYPLSSKHIINIVQNNIWTNQIDEINNIENTVENIK